MKLHNMHIGDKAFGAIPTYNGSFQKGWKVKKFEVVKETKSSIWIAFDSHTRKYPQLIRRNKKQNDLIQPTKELVWLSLLEQEKDTYYLRDCPKRLVGKLNQNER